VEIRKHYLEDSPLDLTRRHPRKRPQEENLHICSLQDNDTQQGLRDLYFSYASCYEHLNCMGVRLDYDVLDREPI